MDRLTKKKISYQRRKKRVRKKVIGLPERPRLSVFRSNKNIYVQAIDDYNQRTITGASSLSPEIREQIKDKKLTKSQISELVGALMAKKCIERGVKKVVFDRNGFLYRGRVKTLADSMRKNGLEF